MATTTPVKGEILLEIMIALSDTCEFTDNMFCSDSNGHSKMSDKIHFQSTCARAYEYANEVERWDGALSLVKKYLRCCGLSYGILTDIIETLLWLHTIDGK
jgi:hypothetical protein